MDKVQFDGTKITNKAIQRLGARQRIQCESQRKLPANVVNMEKVTLHRFDLPHGSRLQSRGDCDGFINIVGKNSCR